MSLSEVDSPETTLWTGSVSHWHYAGKWFSILLLLAALVGTFYFRLSDDPTLPWIVRGVLAVAVIVLFVWIRLDRKARTYTITSRRVSVEFGIISKQSNELRIQDIRSINLTTTGVAGLVGIGRLEFSTAASDDADVVFWNVPGAEKLRDMVRSLQA